LIPPKIQNILNRELEPGEQVIYTKVPWNDYDCYSRIIIVLMFAPAMMAFSIGYIIVFIEPLFESTDDLSSRIQWACYFSPWFLPGYFVIYLVVSVFMDGSEAWCTVITDHRVIKMNGNEVRSMEPKYFSDISIIPGNEVVYFQEWLIDPEGKPRLNQLTLELDQDGSDVVAMLNTLKERGSSGNSTLESSQLHSSINMNIMSPIVPPHIQEVLNCELLSGERVVQTVRPTPKYCIFQSSGHAFFLGFGLYLLLVAIGVSLIPSMYFVIPVIFGILVIMLAIRAFRLDQETVYVITNRRAIRIGRDKRICQSSFEFYAFPLFQPYHVFRYDYPNGTGDVIFAHKWKHSSENGFNRVEDGFFGIPNAKDIEKIIKALARHTSAQERDRFHSRFF
jgi:hypothetical protein